MKEKVLEWIENGKDYDEGVALYNIVGKNRNFARVFPGREKRYARKLEYELCKSVGIDWKNPFGKPDDDEETKQGDHTGTGTGPSGDGGSGETDTDVSGSSSDSDTEDGNDSNPEGGAENSGSDGPGSDADKSKEPFTFPQNLDEYPEIIRKVIHEYRDLYTARSIAHNKLSSLPEDNQPETVESRKPILEEMEAASARMDILHAAIESYQKDSTLPKEDELWPPVNEKADPKDELPEDVEELKKMKKNLQTSLTKDQMMLIYQEKTKQEKENPMPEGPKRTKIEKRINEKQKKLELIEQRIADNL